MTTIRHRRGTAAQWSASSRKLAEGEIGYETDTNKFKMGDGVSTWGELEYFVNEADVAEVIDGAVADKVPPAVTALLANDPTIREEMVDLIGDLTTDDLGFVTEDTPGAPVASDIPGYGIVFQLNERTPTWLSTNDYDGGPSDVADYHLNRWANDWAERSQIGAKSPVIDGRKRFELALSDIYSKPVSGVVLGASTSNGSGANPDGYYGIFALLAKMIQHSYNPVNVIGGYGLKVRNGVWTGGGVGTDVEQIGLKQALVLTPGSTPRQFVSSLQHCDGIELMFTPSSSPFTLTIDGGSPITITPDSTGLWRSETLTLGQHTLVLRPPSSGSTVLEHAYFNSGDRNSGFRMYLGTMPGSRSTEWLPTGQGAGFWDRVEQIQPSIIPMMVGANDANGSSTGPVNPVATYKANLQTLIDEAKSRCDRLPWIPLIGQQNTGMTYPLYEAAMREVAMANRDVCTFHSYYSAFETTQAEAQADVNDVWVDGETSPAHLSNRGHHVAANIIAAEWQLPSRKTWPATA